MSPKYKGWVLTTLRDGMQKVLMRSDTLDDLAAQMKRSRAAVTQSAYNGTALNYQGVKCYVEQEKPEKSKKKLQQQALSPCQICRWKPMPGAKCVLPSCFKELEEMESKKMAELKICLEIKDFCKDEKGNCSPSGVSVSFGQCPDEGFDEKYNRLIAGLNISEILKFIGLDNMVKPEDCKIITPAEYDEKYGYDS